MARKRTKQYGYGELPERTGIAYGASNVKTLLREKIDVVQMALPPVEQAWFDRGGKTAQDEEGERREVGPFAVHGKRASDLEWRVYKALRRLGWRDTNITFQLSILGGRRPGGQVLDFVVHRAGTPYVIPVNGSYWHGIGARLSKTKFNEAAVMQAMPGARILPLYTADLMTDEQAYNTLRTLVGRGY